MSMQQTGVATEKVIVGGLWKPYLFLHKEWTVFHEQWSEYRRGDGKKIMWIPYMFFHKKRN